MMASVEELFVPEVNADLKADGDGTVGDLLKEGFDSFVYAEDLVDEIDVIDTSCDQVVDFGEDGGELAFAVFIAEQGLIAEGAGVGASAGELDFGAVMQVVGAIAGEDVVEVMVALYGIV